MADQGPSLSSLASYLPEAKSLVGVLFAVFGNIMISVAINIQKFAHNKLQQEAPGASDSEKLINESGGDVTEETPTQAEQVVLYDIGAASDAEDGTNEDALKGQFTFQEESSNSPQGSVDNEAELGATHFVDQDSRAAASDPTVAGRPTSLTLQAGDQTAIGPLLPETTPATLPVDSSHTQDAVGSTGRVVSNCPSTSGDIPVKKDVERRGGYVRASDYDAYEDEDNDDTDGDDSDGSGDSHYLKSKQWWAGMILMISGEVGNFMAYGYAPASVVAPLGTVALISNAILAPLMLKEKFRSRDLLGIICAIFGAVVVVVSSKTEEAQLGPAAINAAILQTKFLIYTAFMAVMSGTLVYLSDRIGERFVVVDLGLVAIFGGYTVMATKAISSLLGLDFFQMFTYPTTYLAVFVLVSTAVLQIKYLNKALQRFDSTQVIPTQFVLFTIAAIMGGGVLYNDFDSMTKHSALSFVCGCCMTFMGVYFITSKRVARKPEGVSVPTTVDSTDPVRKPALERKPASRPPRSIYTFDDRRRNSTVGGRELSYGDEYELKGWGAGTVVDDDEESAGSEANGDYSYESYPASSSRQRLFDPLSSPGASGWRRKWRQGDRYGSGPESTDSIFAQRGAVFWGSVRKTSRRAKNWWFRFVSGGDRANHSSTANRRHHVTAGSALPLSHHHRSYAQNRNGRRPSQMV